MRGTIFTLQISDDDICIINEDDHVIPSNMFVEHRASPIVLAARTSKHVQTDIATILKGSIQKFYVHKTAFPEVI